VRISTRSDAKRLTIEVADNGIGIPKNEQAKVFDRLYRVPPRATCIT
jgi:signal transduction histidine kinase